MILTRARSPPSQAWSGVDNNRSLFLFPLHSRIRRFAKALDKSSLFDAAVYLSITGDHRAHPSTFAIPFVSGFGTCTGNWIQFRPRISNLAAQYWGSYPVPETVLTFIMPAASTNVKNTGTLLMLMRCCS
jgi:hypothetical protein